MTQPEANIVTCSQKQQTLLSVSDLGITLDYPCNTPLSYFTHSINTKVKGGERERLLSHQADYKGPRHPQASSAMSHVQFFISVTAASISYI